LTTEAQRHRENALRRPARKFVTAVGALSFESTEVAEATERRKSKAEGAEMAESAEGWLTQPWDGLMNVAFWAFSVSSWLVFKNYRSERWVVVAAGLFLTAETLRRRVKRQSQKRRRGGGRER
jgi:hypothetical protein